MNPARNEWLRAWSARGRRRVNGPQFSLPPRVHLHSERLEDRLAPAFLGGVRVAAGDVDGDHTPDVVTAAGPGGGPHVRAVSGATGAEILSFYAYPPDLTVGLTVAVGDVTGDGRADVVTAPSAGGGPHVKVFDGVTRVETGGLFAYDPEFRGGTSVAVGDVTGDGRADVVTGAGPGGGPHVKVFDGVTLAEVAGFMAYAPDFAGGVTVALAKVTEDASADIVVGPLSQGGPHVRVFDGKTHSGVRDFFAFQSDYRGGVFVAATDFTRDGRADIVAGTGFGLPAEARVFDGAPGGRTLAVFAAFAPILEARPIATPAPVSIPPFPADTTAPVVALFSPAAGTTTGANPSFVGRATDTESGVGGVQAALDEGDFADVATSADGTFTFTPALALDGSADGWHVVRFRATDRAGNVAEVARTFRLDTAMPGDRTPPTVAVTSPASGQTFAANPTIVGVATDDRSGVGAVLATVDGGEAAAVAVRADGTFTFTPTLPLGGAADGPHTVRLVAVDGAGNASATAVFTFTLRSILPPEADTTPPVVTILTPGPDQVFRTNPSVTGTATDDRPGVVTLAASVDGGAFVTVSVGAGGTFTFTPALPLDGSADGAHAVRFRATDAAGSESVVASLSFTLLSQITPEPLDATAPVVTLTGPASGAAWMTAPTVSGVATDNRTGVALVQVAVNGGGFADVPVAADGTFTFALALPLDGSADGPHALAFRAIDRAGNVSPPSGFAFTLDTVAPTAAPGLSGVVRVAPTAVTVTFSEPVSAAASSPASYALVGASVGAVAVAAVDKVSDTQYTLRFAAPLPDAAYTLAIGGLTDAAGNPLAGATTFPFTVADPAGVSGISPADGTEMVSLTRETVVRFDEPVDPATVNADSVYLIAQGGRVPGTIQVSATELFARFFPADPLSEATEVRVVVDGGLITGRDGLPLDADADGEPGGTATADFRTLPLTLIPGTRVFGYVYDSYNKNPDGADIPVVGATISLDANPNIRAVTDANGYFELGAPNPALGVGDGLPTPDFFVHIDGSTAANAPAGAKYATLGKPFHAVPGQRVQLRMDGSPGDADPATPGDQFHVYLPPMAMEDVVPLDPAASTAVGFGPSVLSDARLAELFPDLTAAERALVGLTSVTYPAGSAQDADGTVATQAMIIPVNPSRLPAPLPAGQNPSLVISIQAGTPDGFNLAGGNINFDVPAPVTFPNLEGLAPGEQSLIWSFDHDAGMWTVIGNGTVSADGRTIVSNPGVGILAPGWHFTQVGTVTEGEPCVENQVCVQVNGGLLGDVIEVDLSGTGGREFQLSSNSPAGRIAEIDNWEQVLNETGKFYFIPNFPDTEDRFTQAPVTAEYTFSGIGRLATDPPEAEERRLFFTVQIKDIRPGYSSSGTNAVILQSGPFPTIFRVEQRLKWLGFRGEKTSQAGGSPVVVVDNDLSSTVDTQALRLFQAVIQADGRGNPRNQSGAIRPEDAAWLNAVNAPVWDDTRNDGVNLDAGQINHEYWATSWTRDVLLAASGSGQLLRITSLTEYPDIDWNGPAAGGPHARHKAGHDIDIGIGDLGGIQTGLGPVVTPPVGPFDINQTNISDDERAVALRILAVVQAAGVERIANVFIGGTGNEPGFPRIHQILDGLGVPNHSTSPNHDDHIHITLRPPAMASGAAGLSAADLIETLDTRSGATGFGTDPRMHYRFELGNGLVLSGRTTPTGGFTEVLTPNTTYSATFYQASTNKSAVYQGRTNASGQITEIGTIILDQFGGTDSDADGVPDVGEWVIGTNPNARDSDGDGVSDDAELTQGLNPLDGVGFPTGVIASFTLPGDAQAVTVAEDLVYVATGGHGLAIIDGSRFDQPVLLGQIDLPGTATDVAFDPARKLAAVATGTSLELVDVSDPMTPRGTQSIALNATRAEAVNGLVYAAAGGFLRAFDLGTGSVVQTLILPVSGEITGMAREGGTLYAYVSGSDTLLVIDVSREGEAAVRGQLAVSIASSDVGVFAGNGVVTLAGSGLTTVDVSNPAAPRLISGADSFFTARRVALNGSGLALVAPDGGNTLELYSSADPQNTANFLTRYTLAGPARDVAVSRGLGYVAAGGRLDVVNYRPFDALGQAPTVALTAEAADADPNTDGVQVLEGGTVFLRAAVTDDVQARQVEWLVNGQVAGTDVSFPFDFAAAVPVGVGGTLTVQARVTDTGGNATTSDPVAFAVVPDTFAPAVVLVDPADGVQRFEGQRFVRVRFSEALDPAGVTAASFRLESAGPNGTFGDADDAIVPADLQLRDGDRLVQLTVPSPGLAPGTYRLVIDQSAVADRAGNPLGTDARTAAFTVVEFDQSAEFLPFGTDVSVRQDDTSFAISEMPFAFEFFGQAVTGPVYVTTNGVVEFGGNTIGGRYTNTGLPVGPARVAMPFWDDLYPPTGGTIGLYDADGVRVVSYLDLPHYSNRGRRYSFQIAFFASGQIQIRYGRMDALGDGGATIGLSDGTRIAVPSLGSIVNDPTRAVTSANGSLNQAGLDALTEDEQNDLLVFTPDGAGGYTIVRNPGR